MFVNADSIAETFESMAMYEGDGKGSKCMRKMVPRRSEPRTLPSLHAMERMSGSLLLIILVSQEHGVGRPGGTPPGSIRFAVPDSRELFTYSVCLCMEWFVTVKYTVWCWKLNNER